MRFCVSPLGYVNPGLDEVAHEIQVSVIDDISDHDATILLVRFLDFSICHNAYPNPLNRFYSTLW